jgi:hypothetical protein
MPDVITPLLRDADDPLRQPSIFFISLFLYFFISSPFSSEGAMIFLHLRFFMAVGHEHIENDERPKTPRVIFANDINSLHKY